MDYKSFFLEYCVKNPYSPITCKEVLSGLNGPYNEQECNARYLSHWLTIFLETENDDLIQEYLKIWTKLILPHLEATLFLPEFRSSPEKDSVNGVIGFAWYIDGFCDLKESNYWCKIDNKLADKITSAVNKICSRFVDDGFPFSIINEHGQKTVLDRTFNHQLWAMAVIIRSNRVFNLGINKFLLQGFINSLFKILHIKKNGIVYHTIKYKEHFWRTFAKRLVKRSYMQDMISKEFGYHSFNLLGFHKLFIENDFYFPPNISLLDSNLFNLIEAHDTNNRYGSTYNPIGLELLSYASNHCKRQDYVRALNYLNRHFQTFFNSDSYSFTGSPDDICLNARLYELSYVSSEIKNSIKFDGIRWYL